MSKLPLTIRKMIRDCEPVKNELLVRVEKATGVKATFNFSWEDAYANLEGASYKDDIGKIAHEYLGHLVSHLENGLSDSTVKSGFIGAWTSKNIALVVLKDADYKAARQNDNFKTADSYNGIRFGANGDLEIVTNPSEFGKNTDKLAQFNLGAVVPQQAGGLPLDVQEKVNKHQKEIDADLAKWRAIPGLADLTFEFDPVPVWNALKHNFDVTDALRYVASAREQIEKHFLDDMLKEAILDEWKAPHKLRLLGEQDFKSGTWDKTVKDSYSGIRLANGTLDILAAKGNWGSNAYKVGEHDITKVL